MRSVRAKSYNPRVHYFLFVQVSKSSKARAWSSTTTSSTPVRRTGTNRRRSIPTGSFNASPARNRASGNRSTFCRSAPVNGRASDSNWSPGSGSSCWPAYFRSTKSVPPISWRYPKRVWLYRRTRSRWSWNRSAEDLDEPFDTEIARLSLASPLPTPTTPLTTGELNA